MRITTEIKIFGIVTLVLMVLNMLFGLNHLLMTVTIICAVMLAVLSAYQRLPKWFVAASTIMVLINVLIGMGYTYPALVEMFR